MKRPLFKLIALIVILFALWEGLAIYHSLNFWKRDSVQASPPDGFSRSPILDLALPDLNQRIQSMRQWDGRVLVVNFWASWCEPCKGEMPMLRQLQAAWPADQVRFVGIGIDEQAAVSTYLRRQPMNYPMLLGSQATLDLTVPYGNRQSAIPFTLVFDPAGRVVLHKLGRVGESELRSAILTASRVRQS